MAWERDTGMPELLRIVTHDMGLMCHSGGVYRLRVSKNPSPSPSQGYPHPRDQALPGIKLRTKGIDTYRTQTAGDSVT